MCFENVLDELVNVADVEQCVESIERHFTIARRCIVTVVSSHRLHDLVLLMLRHTTETNR